MAGNLVYSPNKLIVDNNPFKNHSVTNPLVNSLATGGHDEINQTEIKLAIWNDGYLMPLVFGEIDNDPRRDEVIIYEVKAGDSLIKIASNFNIGVDTIIWANDLKNNKIIIGQELKILSAINDSQITIPDSSKTLTVKSKKVNKKLTGSKRHRSYSHFNSLPSDNLLKKPLLTGRISQGLHAKNGIDIAAPCGTPIYTSAPGLIITADSIGWNGGMGKYVVIYHNNGSLTRYGHLSKVSVKNGNYVPYNKIIGLVGSTGRSTGCHLHFETHGFKNPYTDQLN